MVGKPALVPFILAAIPGASAATVAQVSLDQVPSGLLEAVIATEEAKLTAGDAAAVDLFGLAVAISGDTAVVGAPEDDHGGGVDAGSAYVFVRNGSSWSEQAKLTAGDASADDKFGYSVAISGDTVVVGAFFSEGPAAGSAYVFVRTGTIWSEQQELIGSEADSNDLFGSRVAISGDTLVVAATADDHGTGFTEKGSAYVFVRNGSSWSEQQKLVASDAAPFDYFGHSSL